jgi:16S rRNA (guanine966-N2)-methyltransferase
MRIVAGEFGSRRLQSPRGSTRPTSDRAREALFAALGSVEGDACLDLFAGTGALGLEALSRGAATCVFCEVDGPTRRVLAANIAALGVADRCEIRGVDARRLLRAEAREGRRYDLVLLDPPYASLPELLPDLHRHLRAVVTPEGRAVLESSLRDVAVPDGFRVVSARRVGSTRLAILAPLEDHAP